MPPLRIAFYCEPGSNSFKFSPPDVDTRGVGGAELALIDLAQELARRGHTVAVYNDRPQTDTFGAVEYRPSSSLKVDEEEFDLFILFRNPSPLIERVKAKSKIWWSTDQVTAGDYKADILPFVQHAVTISPYHTLYHVRKYGADPKRISHIDLGVRTGEYAKTSVLDKVPYRLLYCSVPDRGLGYLMHIFPQVKFFFPEAELYITSDYSLWGPDIPAGNALYRQLFDGFPGVHFLGKVPRPELVRLQMSAQVMAYPNAPVNGNAELFCIAMAECQVAGTVPVTSMFGALPTTLVSGVLVEGHPDDEDYSSRYVEELTDLLADQNDLKLMGEKLRQSAARRFNWERIGDQWEQLFQTLIN